MAYELKDYLKAINQTKENLLDSEDEEWEKRYPPFIVNTVSYTHLTLPTTPYV